MSTVMYQPLTTELSEIIRIENYGRHHIASICPYIFINGNPSGQFKFQILEQSTTIFEHIFTAQDVLNVMGTLNNYAHVFFPIVPENPLYLKNGNYTLKLSATGYSFSTNSHIGWCQQFENVQNEMDYIPTNDVENPLAFRIKIYK